MKDKRIAVTRAPHQAGELADWLRTFGAEPLLYPCIAIVPPQNTDELDTALRRASAGDYDWLVLTSANTVEALRLRCEALGLSLREVRTAAVGPATAAAARELLGADVRIVPDEFVAEALAAALSVVPGARVLLPQADIARMVLRDQLAAAGADVTVIAAYRTVMGQGGVDVGTLLTADALTFTSASSVDNCAARVRSEGGSEAALRAIPAFCIGPQTAQRARTHGFETVFTAGASTLAGLMDALAEQFSG